MEIKAYFNDIENIIINELMLARKSIKIAVAWFTDAEFISTLVRKVRGGVEVEILLHHDEINHLGDYSIDFAEFIKYGGRLVWCKGKHSTMHEKFCIVDDEVLIEGTFNWTYYAEVRNDEHIIVFKECPELVLQFIERYKGLKEKYSSGITLKSSIYSENIQVQPRRKRNQSKANQVTKCFDEEELEIFRNNLSSLDKKGKSDDYVNEFYKYWTRYNRSISGGLYMFQQEEFDIQEKFFEFESEYQCILAQRKLDKYTSDFRKKFRVTFEDTDICVKNRETEYDEIRNNIEKQSEKFKNTSARDISHRLSERGSVYDYIKNLHLPCIVDRECWYSVLTNPPHKFNGVYNCVGYATSGNVLLNKHVRNIAFLEGVLNIPLVLSGDCYQEQNEDFARERALYIKMLDDKYSFEQIQNSICPFIDGGVPLNHRVGEDLYNLPSEYLNDLMTAVSGLKAYSFHVFDNLEKKHLKMSDIYSFLGESCPKTYEGKYWWQCTSLKNDLWLNLPIANFIENIYYYHINWYLSEIPSSKYLKAIERLCDIDFSIFRANDRYSSRSYWIPNEIIRELPLGRIGMEKYFCSEPYEELLLRPIDFYHELFDNVAEKLNIQTKSSIDEWAKKQLENENI